MTPSLAAYHVQLAAGDFVRAETSLEGGTRRPLRKDERVTGQVALLRIMTNKKVNWQKGQLAAC